jgi:hypothetical protein
MLLSKWLPFVLAGNGPGPAGFLLPQLRKVNVVDVTFFYRRYCHLTASEALRLQVVLIPDSYRGRDPSFKFVSY